MEPTKKTRAIASDNNDVGQKRNKLFKGVIGRINNAIENGYYLEAITLEESLICDRFASRFTYLYEKNHPSSKDLEKKSKTHFYDIMLGTITSEIDEIEEDDEIKQFCKKDLKDWKDRRNTALHEMAKLAEDSDKIFSVEYAKLEEIAKNGLKVFRKIEELINKTK
jgi:hypothetical protein